MVERCVVCWWGGGGGDRGRGVWMTGSLMVGGVVDGCSSVYGWMGGLTGGRLVGWKARKLIGRVFQS